MRYIYCAQEDLKDGLTQSVYRQNIRELINTGFVGRTVHFVSESALVRAGSVKAVLSKKGKSEGYIWEHMVPYNIVLKKLLDLDISSPDASNIAEKIIEKFTKICVLVKEEDKLLSENGLGHKMPDDWDGEDVSSRYVKTGIQFRGVE